MQNRCWILHRKLVINQPALCWFPTDIDTRTNVLLTGCWACLTGSKKKFTMLRGGCLIMFNTEESGPAHHNASETERGWREWERQKRAACAIIDVPLQRKMQSQLHKHHASTEWQRVLYTESLCSREGARERESEVERENRCKEWQLWKTERYREKDSERSVTRTLKIGIRKQSVQIQTGSLLLS